jgi:hypothetical protein
VTGLSPCLSVGNWQIPHAYASIILKFAPKRYDTCVPGRCCEGHLAGIRRYLSGSLERQGEAEVRNDLFCGERKFEFFAESHRLRWRNGFCSECAKDDSR